MPHAACRMPIATNSPSLGNRVLSTRELAELIDVSIPTVLSLERRGVLRSLSPIGRGAHDGGRFCMGPSVRAYLRWIMRDVPLTDAQMAKAALEQHHQRELAADQEQ
jgi:hypothetical protein